METIEKRNRKGIKKGIWITLAVILVALGVFFYVKFYYVWGEGVKSGELNYVVYKGYVFKTYEGKLIQAGIKPSGTGMESNTFEFSVSNKEVAEELMMLGGKEVDLYYKEYLGAIPWRGHSRYVVDSIIAVKERTLNSPHIY